MKTGLLDKVNLIVYAGVIAGLIFLMGISQMSAHAGRPAGVRHRRDRGSVIFFLTTVRVPSSRNLRSLAAPFLRFIDQFALTTSDLTLLLCQPLHHDRGGREYRSDDESRVSS